MAEPPSHTPDEPIELLVDTTEVALDALVELALALDGVALVVAPCAEELPMPTPLVSRTPVEPDDA
jgi:hypothetical protein